MAHSFNRKFINAGCVLTILEATLTLPGIAGIILTVGMAVDANVLIFERIKEELKQKNQLFTLLTQDTQKQKLQC